jgi:hypothetical protein
MIENDSDASKSDSHSMVLADDDIDTADANAAEDAVGSVAGATPAAITGGLTELTATPVTAAGLVLQTTESADSASRNLGSMDWRNWHPTLDRNQ